MKRNSAFVGSPLHRTNKEAPAPVPRRPGPSAGWLAVAGTAALLAWGLAQLFAWRFGGGDVYPPYSTLRADPLGARAFYESLAQMPGLRVERLYKPLSQARLAPSATLFYAGLAREDFNLFGDETEALSRFAFLGGRIVMTFRPEDRRAAVRPAATNRVAKETRPEADEAGEGEAGEEATKPADGPSEEVGNDGDEDGLEKLRRRLARRRPAPPPWEVAVRVAPRPPRAGRATASATNAVRAIPARGTHAGFDLLSWHSAVYFEPTGGAWRVRYECEGRPVIIERTWGRGSIVLAADSYFLSNEALLRERHPVLLAWIAGPGPRMAFDERHLGIEEGQGIVTLARKYRLGGVLAALALLALLFLWRNATSLLPRDAWAADADETAGGLEARGGFLNLLRRHIPARRLASVCFEEWDRTRPRGAPRLDERAARMKAFLESNTETAAGQPAAVYRRLAEMLNEKGKP